MRVCRRIQPAPSQAEEPLFQHLSARTVRQWGRPARRRLVVSLRAHVTVLEAEIRLFSEQQHCADPRSSPRCRGHGQDRRPDGGENGRLQRDPRPVRHDFVLQLAVAKLFPGRPGRERHREPEECTGRARVPDHGRSGLVLRSAEARRRAGGGWDRRAVVGRCIRTTQPHKRRKGPMFFSAYVGTDVGLPLWREALAQHARYLGLQVHTEARRLGDRRTLSLGWLEYPSAAGSRGRLEETEQQVVAATLHFDGVAAGEANGATLTASLARGEIHVTVPPASPQQICYGRTPHGYVFADDLRLFPRFMDVDLDERAVYALLRYGVIPPSLTLYKQVQRIPNGHALRLSPATEELICIPVFHWADLPRPDREGPRAEQWVAETLDGLLARVPASTVLLFSGGVDSSLMAARLSRLGRKDVRLLNYCFGPEDEEGRLAVRIAARLGLECHQVHHDVRTAGDVLARVGRDYSAPFGDLSVFPTNVLVHEARALAGESRTVVDGSGADGAFDLGGEYRKWQRVYGIPRPLRRWVDAAYRWLQLWKYRSPLEGAGRLLSKSARLPLSHAAAAQNALERIAYTIPDDVRTALE